jgi:hypothetical protein
MVAIAFALKKMKYRPRGVSSSCGASAFGS